MPKDCTPTACQGVPYQQNYNFYQGAEDSLSWFDSVANPLFQALDRSKLGVAGHSLGAAAVSWVGQCDSRVKTIVAWDDLQPVDITKCAANVTVPKQYQAKKLHAPALATTNDYEFNVQPATHVPNPHGDTNAGGGAGDKGYQSLTKAGVDSQLVSFRNGTHPARHSTDAGARTPWPRPKRASTRRSPDGSQRSARATAPSSSSRRSCEFPT